MSLSLYSVRGWCVGLAAFACLFGCSMPVSADEVYVRNKPFKRVVYIDYSLYAPLGQFVQAMRMGVTTSENGHLLFVADSVVSQNKEIEDLLVDRKSAWASGETKLLEAEYDGVVFPMAYVWRDNEVWVPVRLLAERLGFTVSDNKATGIIDIIAPRPISYTDRLAAEELKAEKAAQVERAEQILAARRSEKLKRQKEEAEEARKAAAQKKKAAAVVANNIKRKRVTYSAEGDFPSEFNNDAALAGVTPRRVGRSSASATGVKSAKKSESEGSYPKAKPRPKKKKNAQASAKAQKVAEPKSEVKSTEKKQETSQVEPVKVVPFVSYSNPQVSANYGDGNIEYSVNIFNRSAAEAKKVSVVLSVVDNNGSKVFTKREELGTVGAGETRILKGTGRHPLRSSIPRISYYLEVELNWEGH